MSLSEVHRFDNVPVSVGGGLYWNTLGLFEEMKLGLRQAVQTAGKEFSGIGIDTWGVDFALLGPNDTLIDMPHHYRDSRTDGMVEEAAKIVSLSDIYGATGIQFMQLNTLFQLLSVARTNPWMLDTAERLLMIPSLFNFWFTGEKADELSHVSTSQMFDPNTGDWARRMVEKFGIPARILGEIVPPGTVIGKLRKSIAEEIGASEIPFIAPATHDTGSAVAAVPAESADYAYISCGTWSLVGIESEKPIINDQAMNLNFTNESGVGCIRFLKNVAGLWLVQECRRTWAQSGNEYSFSDLTRMAYEAEPFGCVIDPDDPIFAKPGDMPSRIREYCRKTGQVSPETPGEVIRTALESLALKYRWVIEKLDGFAGRKLETINMAGGGIQNQLLCQLTADVAGRRVLAGPVEATAIGNILVQAIGLGCIGSLAEGREIVRRSFEVIEYRPRPDDRIEEAYLRLNGLLGT
jgi:rhamnulokinase